MLAARTKWGTLATVAMTGLGIAVVPMLDDWVGDWGALLWICTAFLVPFIAGIAWGRGGLGRRGAAAGAVIGAAVVLGPGLGYPGSGGPEPLLWALFAPLAMAQGAIALPVGALARKPRAR